MANHCRTESAPHSLRRVLRSEAVKKWVWLRTSLLFWSEIRLVVRCLTQFFTAAPSSLQSFSDIHKRKSLQKQQEPATWVEVNGHRR